MGSDIPLGRIAGIRVGFNWSVLVIAALYVGGLALGEFPRVAPHMSPAAYWAAGIVGAVLFFASLLAHELGHALLARRAGMEVEGISLWLLGGISRFSDQPPSAKVELTVAMAGPVSSLAVAGVFGLLWWAVPNSGSAELIAVVLAWLAVINVVLAGFNLLPAAPLDGGRVLAAILWWRTGDSTRANAWAGKVGQFMGSLLIGIGVWLLFTGRTDTGIWIGIIGWYIAVSGGREAQQAPLVAALENLRVGQVMTPDPPIAQDWMTVDGFLASVPSHAQSRAFPVQAFDGRISGLLTAEQLAHVDPHHRSQLRVLELAFPIDRVLVARVDDTVLPTLQELGHRPSPQALVVWPDGRVAGTVGPTEVQRALDARLAG